MSREATKEEILAEFQKSPSDSVPKTIEALRLFIKQNLRENKYKGKSIEFVFDRGHVDDMPRYLYLTYKIQKEDLDERV